MGVKHRVTQGECLSSIACNYGFADYKKIYDHPNNTDLKAKRPDPNLVYPGDEIYIPDRDPGERECQTDARHVFVLHRQPTYMNVRLHDLEDQPFKNVRYKLVLDKVELEGTTDASGWVRARIPALEEYAWLIVWPNPQDLTEMIRWRVQLGHLDPLDTTSGVKGRLKNLGYDCGEVNDEQDELYDAAVRHFQEDYDLVVDGIVGPNTREKLQQGHYI